MAILKPPSVVIFLQWTLKPLGYLNVVSPIPTLRKNYQASLYTDIYGGDCIIFSSVTQATETEGNRKQGLVLE